LGILGVGVGGERPWQAKVLVMEAWRLSSISRRHMKVRVVGKAICKDGTGREGRRGF